MKYNPTIACVFFRSEGLPMPMLEYQFARDQGRKWRFDFAWETVKSKVYLEVQGGLFVKGGHVRGAYVRKEHEKRNAATLLGWRGLWVEPRDLCLVSTAAMIRKALYET